MRPISLAAWTPLVATLAIQTATAQALTWSGHWFSPSRHQVEGPFESFDPDGGGPLRHRMYAARLFDYSMPGADSRLPYWDGDRWSFVSGEFNGTITALAVFDDDGIGPGREALYVGGTFNSVGLGTSTIATPCLARFDGQAWSAVPGLLPTDIVNTLIVHADASGIARLYAGGRFTIAAGQIAYVLRRDGTTWTPVGPPDSSTGQAQVYALAEYDLGQGTTVLHAGGSFSQIGGVAAANIARWNGNMWLPLGAGVNGEVRALAAYNENNGPRVLVAGGGFTGAGGAPAGYVARWNGSAWSQLAYGLTVGGTDGVRALLPFDFDGPGPTASALFVGGSFGGYDDALGGQHPAPRTALWDGTTWSALPASPVGDVRAFGSFDAGTGARVWCAGGLGHYPSINGEPNALEWTGSRWRALGRGMNGPVQVLATWDDDGPGPHPAELFAGGDFTLAGDVLAGRVARWDGYDWRPLDPSFALMNGPRAMLPFDADGPGGAPEVLWIGMGGSTAAPAVGTWDGTTLQAVNSGIGNFSTIHDFAVFDEGHGAGPQLFAGGWLDLPGSAEHIARWNGSTFEPVSGGVSPFGNTIPVRALEVFDEDGPGPVPPALFLGGNIQYASTPWPGSGVQSKNNLVRWNGTAWSLVGGLVTTFEVIDLAVFDFDGAGPDPARLCVAYDGIGVHVWDGQSLSPLGGAFGGVTALCVFDDGFHGAELYAAEGSPARLWRWGGSGWLPCGGYTRAGPISALRPYVDPTVGRPVLFAGGDFVGVDAPSVAPHEQPVASAFLGAWLGSGASGSPSCLGDGSATACPCGNFSLPGAATGCLNSLGAGGRLVSEGTPSLQADSFRLVATQMPNSSALLFQGTGPVNGGLGSVFGDGLRCAGGSVIRLATRLNVSGACGYPLAGDPPVSQVGQVAAPGMRLYQVWYRNAAAFCTSGTFNLTNAMTVTWQS